MPMPEEKKGSKGGNDDQNDEDDCRGVENQGTIIFLSDLKQEFSHSEMAGNSRNKIEGRNTAGTSNVDHRRRGKDGRTVKEDEDRRRREFSCNKNDRMSKSCSDEREGRSPKLGREIVSGEDDLRLDGVVSSCYEGRATEMDWSLTYCG